MQKIISRLGHFWGTVLFAFLAMLLSVSITVMISYLFSSHAYFRSIFISSVTSFSVAFIISWYMIGLILKINALEKEQRNLANYDNLTQLLNRRVFFERARLLLNYVKATREPVAVAVIDIDDFKLINDNYGHAAGDAVLRSIAKILRDNIRSTDVVGRIGGEEFAVILANIQSDEAFRILEALRVIIEDTHVAYKETILKITISTGISDTDSNLSDIDDLLALADKALYKAKNAGKNRCFISDGNRYSDTE